MSELLSTNQLREKFQSFFESKGHVRIPSAPLVPVDDASVLFTTAGMHPLIPYLKGQPHPSGKRLTNVQKCLRTTDIDEVGDEFHSTVFEMLGNWSLGDYGKGETIKWSWEFLTSHDWLGIDPLHLSVSVFGGARDLPEDTESASIWKSLGMPDERVAHLGKDHNWWPTGGDKPGPQGPDTEIFYWTGDNKPPIEFDPSDTRWVEIWNNVFMHFERKNEGPLERTSQHNIDTGMGLERTIMSLNKLHSIYEIDTFQDLMVEIARHAQVRNIHHERIIADHIKAATFVMGDENPIKPSNSEHGYVLRRIIRRALRSANTLGVKHVDTLFSRCVHIVVRQYGSAYQSILTNSHAIDSEMQEEARRFRNALARGLKKFEQITTSHSTDGISGANVFHLYESYGFPIELTEELAREKNIPIDKVSFQQLIDRHRKRSRESTKQKFSGGLADHSQMSIKYHTATHLLHQALRDVLGNNVFQRGSNITQERLRFDFSYPKKLTANQLLEVENRVNDAIHNNLSVRWEDMNVQEARQVGALGLFERKYGEKVHVYFIGDYSVEICGGPHVNQTGLLGKFKIIKEESASTGIRRIKGILE